MKKFTSGLRGPHAIDNKTLVDALNAATGADAADILNVLDDVSAIRYLGLMSPAKQAAVFGYLPMQRQVALITAMDCRNAKTLFAALPGDEQADLYNRLSPDKQASLLRSLDSKDGSDLLRLATYPEGSAGSVATGDFTMLSPEMTVAEAIESLRQQAPDNETIYVAYVLDAESRLLGTLSLRELILARPEERVGDILRPDPVWLDAAAPREKAADMIQRYDLLALPVADAQGRMLGIVTVDDAMDVAEAEDASDLARFGGSRLNTSDLDVRATPLFRMFTARFFWLALLTLFGVLTSNLVAKQEALLSETTILAAFLAPIIDMGGNTGSQSATLVIRAMALGQVQLRLKDFWFVVKRDLPVALMLGLTLALLEAVLASVSKGVEFDILLIVGLSMLTVTVAGSLIGLILPFAAQKIGADPATLSSPLITSVMDLMGVVIYFMFAYALLGDFS